MRLGRCGEGIALGDGRGQIAPAGRLEQAGEIGRVGTDHEVLGADLPPGVQRQRSAIDVSSASRVADASATGLIVESALGIEREDQLHRSTPPPAGWSQGYQFARPSATTNASSWSLA